MLGGDRNNWVMGEPQCDVHTTLMHRPTSVQRCWTCVISAHNITGHRPPVRPSMRVQYTFVYRSKGRKATKARNLQSMGPEENTLEGWMFF